MTPHYGCRSDIARNDPCILSILVVGLRRRYARRYGWRLGPLTVPTAMVKAYVVLLRLSRSPIPSLSALMVFLLTTLLGRCKACRRRGLAMDQPHLQLIARHLIPSKRRLLHDNYYLVQNAEKEKSE